MFKIEHLSLHHLHNWGSQTLCRWVFLGKKLHQRRPGMTMDGSKFYEDSFLGAWAATCLMASKDSWCFLCVSLLLEGFGACRVRCVHYTSYNFTNMQRKKVKDEGISYSRICLEVMFFFSHPSHQNFLRTALGCLILYHWGCISNCGWDGLAYLVVKWVKHFGWKQIKVHEHQSPDPTNTSNFYWISGKAKNMLKKNMNFKQSPDPLH